MKTRTEKLMEDIMCLLFKFRRSGMGDTCDKGQANQILQACKDAGLKFAPDTFSYEHTGKIPAQLFDSVWKAIGSQIEEIDIEI